MSSSAIIGTVIAVIIVILILLDVTCYFVNRLGVIAICCNAKSKQLDEEDPKLGRYFNFYDFLVGPYSYTEFTCYVMFTLNIHCTTLRFCFLILFSGKLKFDFQLVFLTSVNVISKYYIIIIKF